jgi:hypothetical protein
MLLVLKKILEFIKGHWKWFVAGVAGFVALIILKTNNSSSLVDSFIKLQKTHDDELKKIDLVRKEEQEQKVANDQKLKETLKAIEEQHEDALKNLDEKNKEQIAKIVEKHGNDPDALASELNKTFGFKVILPQ